MECNEYFSSYAQGIKETALGKSTEKLTFDSDCNILIKSQRTIKWKLFCDERSYFKIGFNPKISFLTNRIHFYFSTKN